MLPPHRTIATFLPISWSLIHVERYVRDMLQTKPQVNFRRSFYEIFSTFSFIRKNDATDTAAAPSTICFSTFATSLMPCHQSFSVAVC